MGLFSKTKNTETPQTERAVACVGAKKIRLNFGAMSEQDISAMSSETLQAGGWVEAPEPEIGDKMPDGTVFAGISPDTSKPMYATPADAPLTYTFNEARAYAKELAAHGHQDWRVPTKAELNVLFNNRAAIGGFNLTGSSAAGWYWSASQHDEWTARDQRFRDGYQFNNIKVIHSSLRCVR